MNTANISILRDQLERYRSKLVEIDEQQKELALQRQKIQHVIDGITTAVELEGGSVGDQGKQPTRLWIDKQAHAMVGGKGLTPAIKKALPTLPSPFNVHDVMKAVSCNKLATVSSALRRLSNVDKIIEVVEQGAGKRPTKYRYDTKQELALMQFSAKKDQ